MALRGRATGEGSQLGLLGPVELDSVADVAEEADLIVSADVGRPASRMGDINGDGLADLVFIRPGMPGQFILTAILGGNGGGVDLPRVITRVYDPIREEVYRGMGLETFCPTQMGSTLVHDYFAAGVNAAQTPARKHSL